MSWNLKAARSHKGRAVSSIDRHRFDSNEVRCRTYHVYPVNDMREHDTDSCDCWCGPRIAMFERGQRVIHNAMDGRDLVERHGVN